jgi:hypothetical protein
MSRKTNFYKHFKIRTLYYNDAHTVNYMWGSGIYWHVEQLHDRFISPRNFFLKYPNQASSVLTDI